MRLSSTTWPTTDALLPREGAGLPVPGDTDRMDTRGPSWEPEGGHWQCWSTKVPRDLEASGSHGALHSPRKRAGCGREIRRVPADVVQLEEPASGT